MGIYNVPCFRIYLLVSIVVIYELPYHIFVIAYQVSVKIIIYLCDLSVSFTSDFEVFSPALVFCTIVLDAIPTLPNELNFYFYFHTFLP